MTAKHVADRKWEYPPGGGGTGSSRLTPHSGVHSDMVGNHCGTGVMPTHLLALYQGRLVARNYPDDEMV